MGCQPVERAQPARLVGVAVPVAGEAFMAEMHLGLAAQVTQENGDQGGVLAMLPFPGKGQARTSVRPGCAVSPDRVA